MNEASLHLAVCQYIRLQYPDVMFNTDMSGLKLSIGQAKKAKMMRSNRGFPDLMILEPMGGFGGLFIELKVEGVNLKKRDGSWASEHIREQSIVLDKLRQRNYVACFSVGFDQFKKIIDNYLNLK